MEYEHKKALSLVIPTHNRARLLNRLLSNILSLKTDIALKVIVVDNNSSDDTKNIVASYSQHDVTYVFEENTSFTKARHTGAAQVKTDLFVYLDDDVIIHPGVFDEIVRMFEQHPDAAVIGGKIMPQYEAQPPEWIAALQRAFNGFSLYDLGDQEKECDAIPGPLMAIKKSVFDLLGGFPPDTVGVETNTKQKSFRKLYIGPGDYGFCKACKDHGYKVYYSPRIVVSHVIPPARLTKDFWLSRMVGEGHCKALTQFYKPGIQGPLPRVLAIKKQVLKHYASAKIKRLMGSRVPLLPDEMWCAHYRSFLTMYNVLVDNPHLASYLWELGLKGVPDKDFDAVVQKLPAAYCDLTL